MLEGHSVLPRRRGKVVAARAGCKSKRLASKGSVGVTSKNLQCEVCEIFVNSETQLSQVKLKKSKCSKLHQTRDLSERLTPQKFLLL